MRESDIKLKSCPCCGGKAKLQKQSHREYAPTFSVVCTSCRLKTIDYINIPSAMEVWNRRMKNA